MSLQPSDLAIDANGIMLTITAKTTIRDSKTKVIHTQHYEVRENTNKYQFDELKPLTPEQYQEYISNEETEEENETTI